MAHVLAVGESADSVDGLYTGQGQLHHAEVCGHMAHVVLPVMAPEGHRLKGYIVCKRLCMFVSCSKVCMFIYLAYCVRFMSCVCIIYF